MRLPDKATTAFVSRNKFNELLEVVRWLCQNSVVGAAAPLELKLLPQGRAVGVNEYCSKSNPTELGFVIGTENTDDWDFLEDGTPVDVKIISDVWYDSATHKIYCRTRTLRFDACRKLYAVTAESSAVEITTAVGCP